MNDPLFLPNPSIEFGAVTSIVIPLTTLPGTTMVSFNLGSRLSNGLLALYNGEVAIVFPSVHSYSSTRLCTGVISDQPPTEGPPTQVAVPLA